LGREGKRCEVQGAVFKEEGGRKDYQCVYQSFWGVDHHDFRGGGGVEKNTAIRRASKKREDFARMEKRSPDSQGLEGSLGREKVRKASRRGLEVQSQGGYERGQEGGGPS